MRKLIFLIVHAALVFCVGCGGGSAGTGYNPGGGGSSQEYRGIVIANGQPVANAGITLLETGESTVSDQSGKFVLMVPEDSTNVTIEVSYNGTSSEVAINPSKQSIVNVEIDITKPSKPIAVSSLAMTAKIVGLCDPYFENKKVIRQANKAPEGVVCTARVFIDGDGKPFGGVRFAVEHRNCDANSQWKLDAASETSEKFSPGIGQLQFKFFDAVSSCEYRIIAPYGGTYTSPIEYRVETFTKQNKK